MGSQITSAPEIPWGLGHREVSRGKRVPNSSSAALALCQAEERGDFGASIPLQCSLLCSRYLKQISELTFPKEEQLKKFNHLKTYNLQEEMKSLR